MQSAGRGAGAGARVVRALGRPDVARDVIEGLLLDRGLARGFDAALEREARSAGERVARAPGERRDLRDLPTFTIDPASARDFDDAISAEPIDGATRDARVGAHRGRRRARARRARRWIARRAGARPACTRPGAVEPMLPQALSSDACSLVPGADRAAVTVELELRGAASSRAPPSIAR